MDKLCQFNVFLEGVTGSNSNLIFCETRLAKICGKPYSKLKHPIDVDSETESQTDLETSEP